VGAADADVAEPTLADVADALVDVLLQAGTTMPANTAAAATLATAIIRVVIRGTPCAVASPVP
jgi:hypothetical protein